MATFKEWLKRLVANLTAANTAPSTQAPTRAKPKPAEPYVFVTAKGKRYHWDRLCPCLRNAQEIKMDLSKARKAGYTPCDKCVPDYMRK
jgi:hypothetical protein